MLSLYGVPQGEFGKAHARLQTAVGRRRGNTVPRRIDSDNEILLAINELARADVRLELFGGARSPGRKDNDVGTLAVQLTEGAITNAAIANYLAALKLAIAQRRELLLLCEDRDREQLKRKTDQQRDPDRFPDPVADSERQDYPPPPDRAEASTRCNRR